MAMNPDMAGDQGQGANPDAAGDQGGSDPMKVLDQLGQGLQMVVDGLTKDKAPQEVLGPFQASLQAFTAGYQALQGAAQPQQGASPVEAGGAQVAPAGNNQMRG